MTDVTMTTHCHQVTGDIAAHLVAHFQVSKNNAGAVTVAELSTEVFQ